MPRLQYGLIYTDDPPAVDILRVDFLTGELKVGENITFQWYETKEKSHTIPGKLRAIGKNLQLYYFLGGMFG